MAASSNAVDAATRARHLLVLGALLTAVGVLVAGTVARAVGGALTLAGWGLGIFGLHAFGRLGRFKPEGLPAIADTPPREHDDTPSEPSKSGKKAVEEAPEGTKTDSAKEADTAPSSDDDD